MSQIAWLDNANPIFPRTDQAHSDPNGLLAAGGNLSTQTLLNAYTQGIFPWYSDGQPILWWSPSPRMTLKPQEAHFGRSLRKLAKKKHFEISVDTQFTQVMCLCADITRADQDGTWITDEIIEAYTALHTLGFAHSVESWHDGQLVGGLYGVAIGNAFFGESMFSLVSGASKIAFASLIVQLNAWNYTLIDCQMHTEYLASFGAQEADRQIFEKQLSQAIPKGITKDRTKNTPDTRIPSAKNWQRNWQLPKYGYDGVNLNDALKHIKEQTNEAQS